MTNNKTRRLVLIAMLSAISGILMIFQFPLIPAFDWLKIDVSVVPILFGMFIMGIGSAWVILFVRSIVYILISGMAVSTLIGMPMNIVAMGLFITLVHMFTKNQEEFSSKQFVIGGLIGTLVYTLAMMVMNYFYALPMYLYFMHFDLAYIGATKSQYIFFGVLPFNLLQGVILVVLNIVVLVPMKKLIFNESQKFAAGKAA